MNDPVSDTRNILITGGTSGLGLCLVRFFLGKGYFVAATGRKNVKVQDPAGRFTFIKTDFSDMRQTSEAVRRICRDHEFDIVINNAGVLSPPGFMLTADGNEYTFQVNFLSHLMLNEIVLRNTPPDRPTKIAAIVSPVYRIAKKDLIICSSKADYTPLKAYSNSKLYLALMCAHLPRKHPSSDLKCIAFDPGVFSSGIYRMQKEWFRMLYRVAAPFMRSPEKVTGKFGEIIEKKDLVYGVVYKSGKKIKPVPGIENDRVDVFWQECYKMIEPYLDT